jgi:serine-type D-Ala-D-Ala carboxypeptidase (penicillin-binding protein 5/6)
MYTEHFVKAMNATAREAGMRDTHYLNPHGLDSNYRLEAYSTAHDQALLVSVLLGEPECLRIMGTHKHTGELKNISGKEVDVRRKTWRNTHVLLTEAGYLGGKTGQTQHAGNCLASIYESPHKTKYIIVILGCGSREQRFRETQQLVRSHILGRSP